MSIYKKFETNDILHSLIHATPRVILASGSHNLDLTIGGWRGNYGPSASLSLYEGIRARRDVRSQDFATSGLSIYPLDPEDTHSIDKVIFVSGSYPATGSVRVVKVRRTAAPNNLTDITAVDWYEEHFSPIERLYDYYSRYRDGFFTGSYDHYSLFFYQDQRWTARAVYYSGSALSPLSSAFSMEARVKPTRVLSTTQDFTIQSQQGRWKFYITGSSGKLAWTDFHTILTSSAALTAGTWQGVAFTAGSGSASFYIDAAAVGTSPYTGSLAVLTSSYLALGAERVLSGSGTAFDRGLDGFMFESRIWSSKRSALEVSGNYLSTLTNGNSDQRLSLPSSLRHYSRFNDGPLGTDHGYSIGSGAFDLSPSAVFEGAFQNFGPFHPNWQPNDDPDFVVPKSVIDTPIDMFRVIHVPSMFYGRQIATGSVQLVCNAYNSGGLVRVLNDDGRGGLYVSGSITKNISGEEFRGNRWNKVGNVFYTEGLIVITDPSLLDFGDDANYNWTGSPDLLEVSFSGQERIATKTFICRLGPAMANGSNNPTFAEQGTLTADGAFTPSTDDDPNHRVIVKQEENTTWVTAIGIYNEERQLVAVAKLAQPIRKREKDKVDIRLKFDF